MLTPTATPATPLPDGTSSRDGGYPVMPCAIGPYVPHEAGMCLLDEVLACDEHSLSASVRPSPEDLFAEQDGAGQAVIPAWVGLEWMAQAIAAWSGLQAARTGQSPRVGFLLGSRRYESDLPAFACGQRWQIDVQLDYRADNGLGAFKATLSDEHGTQVARAGVNVFEPPAQAVASAVSEEGSPEAGPQGRSPEHSQEHSQEHSPGQQDAAGAAPQGNV
ncbi:hypothetical protein PJK54_02050 [Cobetia sp. MMG027]|uniref:ApeP family dehydratase n=1 Tax=Cobetia sp. MMG027 TaxID=3021980 RepID=UPI0022FDB4E2|nr:hypothetical protein [Cobetia sp. MMG027]MDA5562453.1 hypothetical protein [Cobetia sp. MMG027]